MAIPQQRMEQQGRTPLKETDLGKAMEQRRTPGEPIPMEIHPNRIKRLHKIYTMLKSKGDDEGLAEFMEYMKSKDSIIGFDQGGNPILEAKKGGAIKMPSYAHGGTHPTPEEKISGEMMQQAGLDTTAPALPTGTELTGTQLQEASNEILQTQALGTTPSVSTTQAATTNLNVSVPQSPNISTYSAYATPNTPTAQAVTGSLNSQAIIGNILGAVSQASQASAAQGTVDQKATVKYQLEQLFSSLGSGTNLPAWASPAVQKVNAIMAQRGLGQSSMAAAAITQSIMESAIPIAAADAKTYATMELANLTNDQAATMQNAMVNASMDKANLDARMSASVNNARNFLSIDLSNLTNQQKTGEMDYQGKLERLFRNQAANNASLQFNAKTQNEVDMFFDELGSQVDNANKNRVAAQLQFNTDQANAQSRFVGQLQDSRDKFNQNMSLQINQSNSQWRRNINTANTTLENETNRINAMNLLQVNQQALNNIWQRYRDEASWLMQSAENAKARAHQVAMFAQESNFDKSMYETQTKDIMLGEIGRGVMKGIFNAFGL
jgi:hypothetical protein